MRASAKEPIFTTQGWIAYGVMSVVYAAILFSLDPEWVAWAAPLAFGGSLVAQDPPPESAHLASTPDTFLVACAFTVASLAILELLRAVRSKPESRLLAWLRDTPKHGSVAKVWSYLKSEAGFNHGH